MYWSVITSFAITTEGRVSVFVPIGKQVCTEEENRKFVWGEGYDGEQSDCVEDVGIPLP